MMTENKLHMWVAEKLEESKENKKNLLVEDLRRFLNNLAQQREIIASKFWRRRYFRQSEKKPEVDFRKPQVKPASSASVMSTTVWEKTTKADVLQKTRMRCRFCELSHEFRCCPKYTSYESRIWKVSGKQLCPKCLTAIHNSESCKFPWRYYLCKGQHVTVICLLLQQGESKEARL